MTATTTQQRSGFADVDRSLEFASLVSYLERLAQAPFVRSYVERSIAELRLFEGATILDVGCGIAHDLRDLLGAVGPTGKVILLDSSDAMLAEADRRWSGNVPPGAVEFLVGDGRNLGELENLSGARVVRTLMHMENPFQAIAEMARVVRRGGRVVAVEPDWESVVIESSDTQLVRQLTDLIQERIASPAIGRQLGGLFASAGLNDQLYVQLLPYRMHSYTEACEALSLPKLLEALIQRGTITPGRAKRFSEELIERERLGEFSATINCYLAAGSKKS